MPSFQDITPQLLEPILNLISFSSHFFGKQVADVLMDRP
jgi:hypothetical protein